MLRKLFATLIIVAGLHGMSFAAAHTVVLNWTAPSPTPSPALSTYNVSRGASAHETFLASVSSSLVTYTDTAVVPGQTYCYRVSSVNINGLESIKGNESCASIPNVDSSVTVLNFDRRLVGSGPSAAKTVTYTNHAGVSVTVQDDIFSNPGIRVTGQFHETNSLGTLPQTVSNGATFTASVTFDPTTAGDQKGQLLVSLADGSTVVVNLDGTGSQPTPTSADLQTDDVSLPFPNPIQPINSQWVNGVAPGFFPQACGGLVLCVGKGLVQDGSAGSWTIRNIPAVTPTLGDNTTTHVYLDHTDTFHIHTSTSAVACGDFWIADVVTLSGAIVIPLNDYRSLGFRVPCP